MKSTAISSILLWLVLLIVLPWADAQQGNPGGGTPGNGSSGSRGNPSPPIVPRAPTSLPSPENRSPDNATATQSIYIAGSVIQEDGTPPPMGTEIEMECGSAKTREATADSGGRFGFMVGSNNRIGRVMPDASDNISQDTYDSNMGNRSLLLTDTSSSLRGRQLSTRLIGCELRAQSPGYQSTSVRLGSGSVFGYNEVPAILIYRMSRVQGTSVSYASLLAPKKAKKLVEQATRALQKNRYDEAEALAKSAIEIYPKSAEAWYVLGQVYQTQQRYQDARDSYMKAVDADSFFVRPYIKLAWLESQTQNWQAVAERSNKALELDPIAFPETYFLNALAFYNLHDLQSAEKSARNGERLDFENQFPRMHLILANIFAIRQDTHGYIEELRNYLKVAPKAGDAVAVRSRLQETEKLAKGN
jgi:tetratricopeptide (TPR) repeat protein